MAWGGTGSTPINSFLKEFEETTVIGASYNNGAYSGFEVSFWEEIGGILSIEENIFSQKFYYKQFEAMNFSINVIRNFYDKNKWIYDKYYFYRSKKFIFDLIEYHWRWCSGVFRPDRFRKIEYMPTKKPLRIEFDNPLTSQIIEVIYKEMSLQEYRQKAKEYMKDIFSHIPSNKFLVCDNLLNIGRFNGKLIEDYFGDIKMIYVWRDPRDQYTNCQNRFAPNIPEDPYIFAKRFKIIVENLLAAKQSNLLVLRFEDFVLNYEQTSKKIINFIGLDPALHTEKMKYADPNKMIHTIGCHKTNKNQEAIKILEKELEQYCYKG